MEKINRQYAYAFKENKRLIVGILIIFVCTALVTFAGVAIYYFAHSSEIKKAREGNYLENITNGQATSGVLEVIGCVSDGELCPRYADAKSYLGEITSEGIAYTQESEKKTAEAVSNMDDEQIQQLAKSLLLNGRVTPEMVTEDKMSESGDNKISFMVSATDTEPAQRGEVEIYIDRQAGDIRLSSITYQKESQ